MTPPSDSLQPFDYYAEFDYGVLDVPQLEETWNSVVRRHFADIPRVIIPVIDGGDPEFAAMREEMSRSTAEWPPFDIRVVRAAGRARVSVRVNSLVLDRMSMMYLLTEVDELCQGRQASRHNTWTLAPQASSTGAHWRPRLPDLPPAPRLPLISNLAAGADLHHTRRHEVVRTERWEAVRRAARLAGVTPSALLLGCYADVLGSWSASGDLTVGVVRFGSVVPVSFQPHPGEPWLAGVRGMKEWQDFTARAATADFPVIFTCLVSAATGAPLRLRAPDFAFSRTPGASLDNQVTECVDGLHIAWDAVEDVYPEGLLDEMFVAYLSMVHRLSTTNLAEISLQQHPHRGTHHRFFTLAAAMPDRVAVRWERGRRLSYGELADMALCVANHLRAEGIASGDVVSVTTEGPDLIAAFLGVLAVGAVVGDDGHVLGDLTKARCAKPLPEPLANAADQVPGILAPLTVGGTVELS